MNVFIDLEIETFIPQEPLARLPWRDLRGRAAFGVVGCRDRQYFPWLAVGC
ncbi:MAG: hypothetical protein WBM86_20465 [Waterburya sp.]